MVVNNYLHGSPFWGQVEGVEVMYYVTAAGQVLFQSQFSGDLLGNDTGSMKKNTSTLEMEHNVEPICKTVLK